LGAEAIDLACHLPVRAVAGDCSNDCQRDFRAHATHAAASGGGRATSLANLRRF
jgi:hypothetical protein